MSYVFLANKKFDNTKRFVFEFQGESLVLFWAIVLISAVISILEDFGSLLPARTVTVKAWNEMYPNPSQRMKQTFEKALKPVTVTNHLQ